MESKEKVKKAWRCINSPPLFYPHIGGTPKSSAPTLIIFSLEKNGTTHIKQALHINETFTLLNFVNYVNFFKNFPFIDIFFKVFPRPVLSCLALG